MENFKTCPQCDFEWHTSDGHICPVCNPGKKNEKVRIEEKNFSQAGLLGTGKNSLRLKKYYQVVGIIALIYFLYQVMGGR